MDVLYPGQAPDGSRPKWIAECAWISITWTQIERDRAAGLQVKRLELELARLYTLLRRQLIEPELLPQ